MRSHESPAALAYLMRGPLGVGSAPLAPGASLELTWSSPITSDRQVLHQTATGWSVPLPDGATAPRQPNDVWRLLCTLAAVAVRLSR